MTYTHACVKCGRSWASVFPAPDAGYVCGECSAAKRPPWRCRWFGHDDQIITDPRPREYSASGRPLLRIAPTQCLRCGSVSYER